MKEVLRNNSGRTAIILSILAFLFALFLFLSFLNRLPPQVPLFYSRSWGEEQLAKREFLIALPIFSFLVFIVNFLIASWIFSKEKLLAQILLWSTTIFSLLATIALVKIILLVGS